MFTKKSISRMFTVLLIVIFMLTGVLPVKAESSTSPRYANGDLLWAKGMGGTSNETGNDIAIDSSGNVYTTGYFGGTADFDPGIGISNLTSLGAYDIFVTKLDSSGNFAWAKSMDGASYDIAINSNDNVYLTGDFSGSVDFDPGLSVFMLTSAGSNDIFVSKLNSNGDFLWAKSMGGTSGDGGARITLDPSGYVYTIGGFGGIVDFDPGVDTFNLISLGSNDIFVSKLDTNGNFVWAKNMGGTSIESGSGITLDSGGNVYTTGRFQGIADFDPGTGVFELTSAGGDDIFVSKMNNNGDFVWAKSMGGARNDASDDLTVDLSGNVYTAGYFYATADFDPGTGVYNLPIAGPLDTFISKLDNNGDFVWAKSMSGTSYVQSSSITIDSSGNIYTSGAFLETADFDPGVGVSYLTSAGGVDICISKLNNSGDFVWAKNMGGMGDDYGYGMALDSGGRIYMTGNFKGTADFDPSAGVFNLISVGFEDIFISKLENEVIPIPQQLVVTKTADTNDGVCNTDCSLREAITAASTGETITFDSALSGQIIALESVLTLSKSVTINGSALALPITISGDTDNDGTGNVQVFYVNYDVTATLDSLTITKGTGSFGGGIYNYFGALTVTNSSISGNFATVNGGGIHNDFGTLTITNSTISGNSARYGGGIGNSYGTLIVTNSTVSGNSASNGGGIFNGKTLTVTNSTLSGNSAIDYNGGGIYNSGTLTITNSTLSSNSAAYGGGITNMDTLTITNSTLSGNSASYGGGGIDNWGILNYANTIIGNSKGGEDCFNDEQFGAINSNTHNLVEDGSCSASLSGDPKLKTLANNGGSTQTIALLAGSSAINAGDNAICAASPVNNLDQRGISRPEGGTCEIGAYEVDIPIIASIKRLDANPAAASSVNFRVTFSEPVTGVDLVTPFSDFALTTNPSITGASITGVSGSGATYTVTVNTGSGNGSIRLDVADDNSIVDASSNPLGGATLGDGNFTTGEVYTIYKSAGGDTAGVFRPSNATFYLRNSNSAGSPNITIKFGKTGDYPVVGDWDGNGTDTIGVYRNGIFYLSNSNTTGHVDLTFAFGVKGDQPIAGDWNGDGKDTVGVYRSSKITFLLRNTNSAGAADATFKLGNPGDVGITGDWNADGKDTTGVFRPSNGALYLKNANTTGYADTVITYGVKNDKPVTGDWNNDGIASIGIFRNAKFYLRNTNTKGYADFVFAFGAVGDMPLAGNWDGMP